MMDEQMILMKVFPQLIANYNFTTYDGFINAEGTDFQISLHVPNYPSLLELSLRCSWMTSLLLAGHDLSLEEWIKYGTLCSFLENLKKLLTLEMKRKSLLCHQVEDRMVSESFKILISDLNKIGFCNVVQLSSSLSTIKLKTIDKSNREHNIEVNLGKTYPLETAQITAVLPDEAIEIISKNMYLGDIYKSFVQQVQSFQPIWNTLDVIDSHCYVLDPEHPTRKDMGRRIMIEKNVSIYINMNIKDTTAVPKITVLGHEQTIQHYQSALSRNIQLWNSSDLVLDNLREVLELKSIPAKSNFEEELSLVQQGECRICYTVRLDGELPSEICEDAHCANAFHIACLFQWLQTIAGNYQSLNRMHGVCPNCGMAISCPIPKAI